MQNNNNQDIEQSIRDSIFNNDVDFLEKLSGEIELDAFLFDNGETPLEFAERNNCQKATEFLFWDAHIKRTL